MLAVFRKYIFKILILSALYWAPLLATAHEKPKQVINNLYQKMPRSFNLEQKLQWLSKQFLNKPYKLGPLGEGPNGTYDQSPLYSTNDFDCTTYVETILALALSSNFKQFKKKLIQIRYQGNKSNYLTRNHFMSNDWNPNNIKKGYVKDITATILNKNKNTIFKIASATIDMSNWIRNIPIKNIKIKDSINDKNRLGQLHKQASNFSKQQAKIKYLPLSTLFKNNQANQYLFKQIPSGSIIEIVRPNWQLKDKIGTNINVSHLGFAFRINKVLYFREASYIEHRVIDIPLIKYLQTYLDSPTIKGINVLLILNKK